MYAKMQVVPICLILFCGKCYVQAAAPMFSSPTTTVDLPESLVVGGLVVQLTATDDDGDVVSYSLTSVQPVTAGDVFSVAPSGEVTTRMRLDYEKTKEFSLVVRAETNNEAAEQTIYVNIINVNEAPEFPDDLIGATAENYVTGGHVVTVMHAVDPDHTLDTVYTITDGNSVGHFLIGQTSGTITVSPGTRLNRTSISAYALTIEAADKGTPPRTGTTTLVIGVCGAAGLKRMDFLFYTGIVLAYLWQKTMYGHAHY